MSDRRMLRPAAKWLVFCVILIELTGFGIVIPILPFMAPMLGGDTRDIALVLVTYNVGSVLMAPFWGRLSDRIGRRRVLMLCLLGMSLSYVALALASTLPQLYFARALAGLMAGTMPVASALMADFSPPHQRARAMGLVGTAFGVGLVLGPVLGGLLAGDAQGFARPAWFACGLSLAAMLAAAVLLPVERKPATEAAREPQRADGVLQFIQRQEAWLLMAQFVCHTMAYSACIYLFPVWAHQLYDWGPHEVGLFFGGAGMVMIIVQGGLLGVLTQRFGLKPVLRSGAVVFASAMALGGSFTLLPWGPAALFCCFAGATLCLPVLNTIASSWVSAQARGQMMGTTAAAAAVGRILGPLTTAVWFEVFGFRGAWWMNALVVGLLLLLSLSPTRFAEDPFVG